MSEAITHHLDLTVGPLGFIGLGAMGGRMVEHLAGPDLLVYDISPEVRERVAARVGGKSATGLADFAAASTVILMLPNSAVVDEVLRGDDAGEGGLLGILAPGSWIIDMSSADPTHTRDNRVLAEARGIHLIDAPVSGGPGGAEQATLSIMVGAAPQEFVTVEPLLAKLGGLIRLVGEAGCGHAVKALNNLLSATMLAATAEVFTAAERFGVDPKVLREVVDASSGGSFITHVVWPRAIEQADYEFGFAMSLMEKDVRTAHPLIQAMDTWSPLSDLTARLWAEALGEAPRGADMVEIVRQVESRRRDGQALA